MTPDCELLRRYAQAQSEEAFAELVRRHVDLVYSAALRQLNGDASLAKDVAQIVFSDLARKAVTLSSRKDLAGWLYTSAFYAATKVVRRESRRRTHEQKAHHMHNFLQTGTDELEWERLGPLLDQAMLGLNEADREIILLRYFQNNQHAVIAERLGIKENAARMRVERAVEKLRDHLSRRGLTTSATALSIVIAANAVQIAPAGLATILSAAGVTGTTLTATTAIVMTTLQKAIIGATLATAIGTGIYQTRRTFSLRDQLRSLEDQQAGQIQKLEQERDEASANVATLRGENDRLKSNTDDLLRLRGEIARLRAQTQARLGADESPSLDSSNATDGKPNEQKLPKESWADVGFATPEKALQTRGWAVINGNRERFKESVFITEDARKTLEDMFLQMVEKSTDPDKAQFVQKFLDNNLGVEEGILFPMIAQHQQLGFTGYNILATKTISADELILEVETGMTSAPAKKDTLKLHRYGTDWKVVIDDDFVKKAR